MGLGMRHFTEQEEQTNRLCWALSSFTISSPTTHGQADRQVEASLYMTH